MKGNWVDASIDAGGVVLDMGAAIVPFVPAVGSTSIKAGRKIVKGVAKNADKAADVSKASEVGKAVNTAGDASKSGVQVTRKIPKDKLKYKPKKRGNAPIGEDGKPVELHHLDQTQGNASARAELTRTDHRGKGNYKKNHPNTGQKPSTVDRTESSQQHRQHWENEWDADRFDDLP